jgi:FkbM family methyltransferase
MLRWLVRFAWLRARGTRGPIVATLTIRGLTFTLDWAAAEHVAVREILVRREYAPTPEFEVRPGQTVVDVGANAGVFSTVAGSRVGPTGRLISIEPNPTLAGRLHRNLGQNGLDPISVVISAAVADRDGRGTLFVGSNTATGTLAPSSTSNHAAYEVALRSLDAIAVEVTLGEVDLLKIDVEGMELPVLDGARRVLGRCRRMVIEVSSPADVNGVMDRCREAGFDRVGRRSSGPDSGATLVFAAR